jgi:hypothetical protein
MASIVTRDCSERQEVEWDWVWNSINLQDGIRVIRPGGNGPFWSLCSLRPEHPGRPRLHPLHETLNIIFIHVALRLFVADTTQGLPGLANGVSLLATLEEGRD